MGEKGNIFNPDYYLVNTDDGLVYRREQFSSSDDLYAEYVVADKRYTMDEIEQAFVRQGLRVVEKRYVQAGHWNTPLQAVDVKAKEILLVVRNL